MDDITDVFKRRRRFPIYWMNKATDLHAAAAALWASMDRENSQILATRFGLGAGFSMEVAVGPVFRMLCGLSLELVYKALIVQGENTPPRSHNLCELARLAKIDLSGDDAGLVTILGESVRWDGRYPVPKDREAWGSLNALASRHLYDVKTHGRLRVAVPNRALSWEGFERLWNQARSRYVYR